MDTRGNERQSMSAMAKNKMAAFSCLQTCLERNKTDPHAVSVPVRAQVAALSKDIGKFYEHPRTSKQGRILSLEPQGRLWFVFFFLSLTREQWFNTSDLLLQLWFLPKVL